ncbi:hypothetical protein KsCSTR_21830 [Candidatus Kuenenia stuttgartiensis]|uniref:Uncharacterized protein n=1 Tax=Kuenenia stuttgartiensis TaxID=174633 RepID=Q1Q372_KUEST|nr:hypothetical protein KsCSTR_21830 [Candidatus Kuenenia stuttgartiensis]CAJ74456.1 unknown protein [Candidatus Kuenenia stuttgartiensis]
MTSGASCNDKLIPFGWPYTFLNRYRNRNARCFRLESKITKNSLTQLRQIYPEKGKKLSM